MLIRVLICNLLIRLLICNRADLCKGETDEARQGTHEAAGRHGGGVRSKYRLHICKCMYADSEGEQGRTRS